MSSLPFLFVLFSLVALSHGKGDNNYAAALCCGKGPSCNKELAKVSGICKPGLWMTSQSSDCQQAACKFCKKGDKRRFYSPACVNEPIVKNCFDGNKPRPSSGGRMPKPHSPKPHSPKPHSPKPDNSKPNRKGCAYGSNVGKVVIDATELNIGSNWDKVGNAIVWKKTGGGGIDAMGSGAVCANVKFSQSGVWYMTGVSSAPHPTEHNDAWWKFSGGVDLYRPQARSYKSGNNDWYKGYQNNGANKPADYILTIDHNGHQFLTKPVTKGKVYKVCVAGRSSKYSLYKIVFVKCDGGEACSRYSNDIKKRMQSLKPSRCT